MSMRAVGQNSDYIRKKIITAITSLGSRVWLFNPREYKAELTELTNNIKIGMEHLYNVSIDVHNIADGCFIVASKKQTDDDMMVNYQKHRLSNNEPQSELYTEFGDYYVRGAGGFNAPTAVPAEI